ncbi:MAG TPA: transaldolase [Armatimonadetes bacterium]|nr:transaldolase [Armatimonadota bacterium]
MNPLQKMASLGQSPWLDYIRRDMIHDGTLARMRDEGVLGVTSNPAIFEQAIAQSDLYDDAIRALAAEGKTAMEIYDILTVADVQDAADVMRPVWEASGGQDGYVSLEVSPLLANDTNGTILDAHRLHRAVDRPNVMIKIPATLAGLPAIQQCLADGIPVNVTLLFSRRRYQAVMDAYIEAMTERAAKAKPVQVASVASFFVSRVDSLLDPQLDAKGAPDLKGKLAIANAQGAFADFRAAFSGAKWEQLESEGAWKQRVLWASTSTKNPAYPDLLYVDNLIGPDTVNTMPPATYAAFRDHGMVARTLDRDVETALAQLAALPELGIDLSAVTDQLEIDGVNAFIQSFANLLAAIEAKTRALAA